MGYGGVGVGAAVKGAWQLWQQYVMGGCNGGVQELAKIGFDIFFAFCIFWFENQTRFSEKYLRSWYRDPGTTKRH